MTTDGNLGIELIGSNGRYLLLDYLGGGQTAGVYRARVLESQRRERLNCLAAVKLMAPDLDAETRGRFLKEAEILVELQGAESRLRRELKIEKPGPSVVPEVWDEQQAGVAPFFVMTLAEGEPLDEILRRQRRLPEAQALNLGWQIAEIFAALHEGLDRSYLDFQPRNFFWQAEIGRLTVIDWNLLSLKGQADVAGDLAQLAGLLGRMLTGGEAQANGRAGSVETKEWGEISRGTRNILRRALDPRPALRYGTANELRAALQRQFGLWQRYGDDLLVDAGALERQSSQASQAGEAGTARDLLEKAWVLFDMALRRGTSPNPVIQKVREGLQGRLESQMRAMAPLQTGRMLLDGRDYAKALEMFSGALAEARQPGQRLVARRWLAIGEAARRDYAGYGVVRDKLGPLLQSFEETAWAENDWSVILERLKEVGVWDGVGPVSAEVAAYADLQAGLASSSRIDVPLGGDGFQAGLVQLGHNIAEVKDRLARLRAGVAGLDELPFSGEGPSYRSDAWAFIGDGDTVQGQRWVDDITGRLSRTQSSLEDLQKRLTELQAQLTGPQSVAAWHALLADFGAEPLVIRGCLDTCWELLGRRDDAASLKLVHAILESGGSDETLRAEADRAIQLVAAFRRSDALLSVLTTLYQAQAKAQGRAPGSSEAETSETPEVARGKDAGTASDLLPAAPDVEAQSTPLSEPINATEPTAFVHKPDDSERLSVVADAVERQAEAVESARSVEIETVRLGDAGQVMLALAAVLRAVFEQIPSDPNTPAELHVRAATQLEKLANVAFSTGQGILSADALIASLVETGAISADAAQAWRRRLAQAKEDQDLSETAKECYSKIENARWALANEETERRKSLESESAAKRSEIARLAAELVESEHRVEQQDKTRRQWDLAERTRLQKEHVELSQRLNAEQSVFHEQTKQAKAEFANAQESLEAARTECKAERQRLLEAAHAEAKIEHDTIRQELDGTLEERRRQLADIEEKFAQREQKETQWIHERIQSLQQKLGEKQAQVSQVQQELTDLAKQRDELRRPVPQPDEFISNARVPIAAQALELVAQAARMVLSDTEASWLAAADVLRKAQEQAKKSGNNQVVEVVNEWKRWLELFPDAMRMRQAPWPTVDADWAGAWKLISQAWEALYAGDKRKIGQLEGPMDELFRWAENQIGDNNQKRMLGLVASWQQGVAESRSTPIGRPRWAESQELIGRALQFFTEGGTINDCTSVIKDIQSLNRSAGRRSQQVESLLTKCGELLEAWRSNANSLLAEWNGQIKYSPLRDVQNRITSLAGAGVKGEKKPGDILAATAKAVQDRFDVEYRDHERTQNPTRGTTGRPATSIREEMNRLITFQETLFDMSKEIVQGGETAIAEQLDRMKKIRSNLDYQR